MPSARRQLNVRLEPETEELLEKLLPVVSARLGLKVSQSDLVRLGLLELQAKYLGPAQSADRSAASPPSRKKRRRG